MLREEATATTVSNEGSKMISSPTIGIPIQHNNNSSSSSTIGSSEDSSHLLHLHNNHLLGHQFIRSNTEAQCMVFYVVVD